MTAAVGFLVASIDSPDWMEDAWDSGANPDLWLYRRRTEAILRKFFRMSVEAVTKKKAKKAGGKRWATTADSGPKDLSVTHEKVKHVIREHAEKMTTAIAAEAEKGNLPTFKYLFELLGTYPAPVVEHAEAKDSNDLARVLLNRFDFPYKGPADEEQDGAAKDEAGKDTALVPAGAREDSVD